MENLQISTSNLTNHGSATHLSKAWHLVSILLTLRRPATVAELAAKCILFKASPDYVEFLCFVDNSPLLLMESGCVSISAVVFVTVGEFASQCGFGIGIGVGGGWREVVDVRCLYCRKQKRGGAEVWGLKRRRSVSWFVNGNDEENQVWTRDRDHKISVKVRDHPATQSCTTISAQLFWCSTKEFKPHCSNMMMITPEISISGMGSLTYEQKHLEGFFDVQYSHRMRKITADSSHSTESLLHTPEKNPVLEVAQICILDSLERVMDTATSFTTSPAEDVDELCKEVASVRHAIESFGYARAQEDNACHAGEKELIDAGGFEIEIPSRDSLTQQSKKLSSEVKNVTMVVLPCVGNLSKPPRHAKGIIDPNAKQACRRDTTISIKHKSRHISKDNIIVQETDTKEFSTSKPYPKFPSFLVEEEEGSGGYGTVYRVRRKSDGTTFAIKYPHANAHKNHVNNELKMLKRFGGRNFVIKYEGSVKSGSSDCFVLQYVEHDRPEVLKKQIDVHQLQWYGYCMFKALASLHKQEVVHRDVKPGNFLFSPKYCKGFLIDFNLAKDLGQKYEDTDRSKAIHSNFSERVPTPNSKLISPSKQRKILSDKFHDSLNGGAIQNFKSTTESKILKKKVVEKKTKSRDGLGHQNSFGSQGADGSGLTSAKDATSTRTPSVDRLKEPLPSIGRKELINLAQAAMESPNQEAAFVPTSKRKRAAALLGNMNKRPVYFTSMLLHSSGIPVCGSSLLKRGEGRPQKEGACVGTKGFRAPEVLLRSSHQGPKVDVWSAGVTLLYLMTGKLVFNGDPEQNMKEIVKLRGSEDLWEVAKLHNRESSFPMDLFDVKFLPSTKLLDWCKANTKRKDFLETVPSSAFDLIDKCLTVNPRLRITAEEALQHDFFASCHKELQRQRLLRQGLRPVPHNSSSSSVC